MSLRTLGLNLSFKGLFKKPQGLAPLVATVMDFKQPEAMHEAIMTRCDREIGGYSDVEFDIDPVSQTGHFHGYLNLDLPKDNPEVTRLGYAMFRTRDQKDSWLSGNQYWDWLMYDALALRVLGDKRKYLVNLQANTPLVTDLYQHRLFLNTPGEWETVVIPLNDFVMTNWGVIQDGSEINKAEVKTVGIGLLDKQYGPFSLHVDWIKVMTGAEVEKLAASAGAHGATGAAGARGATGAASTMAHGDRAPETAEALLAEQGAEFHLGLALRGTPEDPKNTIF